jgi:hypothetical protein
LLNDRHTQQRWDTMNDLGIQVQIAISASDMTAGSVPDPRSAEADR